MTLPRSAKVYITAISALGLACMARSALTWQSADPSRFVGFALLALASAALKIWMPGVNGTMSVSFLFILIAAVEFSRPEAVLIAVGMALIQCLWRTRKRPRWFQVAFNVGSIAAATFTSHVIYRWSMSIPLLQPPLRIVLLAIVYFAANTLPVAVVMSFTERNSIAKLWRDCYFWSFPYYLVGGTLVVLMEYVKNAAGWQASLLVLPVAYFIYHGYRLYVDRLEAEKKQAEEQRTHASEMAALHLRTIESLALAIEAKDQTTSDHLRRVQVYALAVGKELNLPEEQLYALQAASMLHDIGKLAVPEHIISKPGKLTAEEFEKMKIHPVVGAEILERVQFPYPVVPIVRSHHEKWNGAGYPDGLKQEEIPIGARILSAVDCLDALASDRQYRRALPLDEAMAVVVSESGKSFDPKIVEILQRRYLELEEEARGTSQGEKARLSTNIKVERGEAPAAGFERSAPEPAAPGVEKADFLASIASARQEGQAIFELSQNLGNSLSLQDTFSVLSQRLKRMVPHDSVAVYLLEDGALRPEYVAGDDFRLFSSLHIPLGQGLSGWVAENRRPIINGNPSVEPGYLNDSTKFSSLRAALSVPLEGLEGCIGVLTLYRLQKDAFTKDHLRVLLAISAKLGVSVENSLRFRKAEDSATNDFLTGLPNLRSLFIHIEAEIERSQREHSALAILVTDLNGFKQVNDRFGHLEGNRLLQAVANVLKHECRSYDFVARIGGDEFVIVMPGANPKLLNHRCETISESIVETGKQLFNEEILSLSIGVAEYPHDGTDAEQLLAAADKKMYKAKRAFKETRQESLLNLAASMGPGAVEAPAGESPAARP